MQLLSTEHQGFSGHLRENEVHLWIAPLDGEPSVQDTAKSLLSAEESAKAERFLRARDRRRYQVAHGMLRAILSLYAACSPAELQFDVAAYGKPSLAQDINPAGLTFNMSHSGDRMLVGVVRNVMIGVDLEEVRPEAATLDVAARFFTPWENAELKALFGAEQVTAFFNCWTRKEAYLKALGCGLSVDPRECEVTLRPGNPPQIRRVVPNETPGTQWNLYDCPIEGSFISAIAVNAPSPRFVIKKTAGQNQPH